MSRIGNPTGGLSGQGIKPITLRLVYEASRAVRIPVVGLGGIDTAEDVLEYFVVGASAVQVGTASFADPNSCARLATEVEKLCAKEKISAIRDLRGTFRAQKN